MAYAGPYIGKVTLQDNHGLKATKQFEIWVDDVAFATAAARLNEAADEVGRLATDLDNVVDGQVIAATITVDITDYATGLKATPGEQGVAEGAIVRVYKEDGTLHPYWIPSAKAGIFLADFATVDTADTELNNFMIELGQNGDSVVVMFSDGETLDLAAGANGMRDGYYATKPRNTRD